MALAAALVATLIRLGFEPLWGLKLPFIFFYPAIMPTTTGGAGLVFGRSGPGEFASAFLTGRRAGDVAGTMRNPARFGKGQAGFEPALWGAHNGVSPDPSKGRRIYGGAQAALRTNRWKTFFAADDF